MLPPSFVNVKVTLKYCSAKLFLPIFMDVILWPYNIIFLGQTQCV